MFRRVFSLFLVSVALFCVSSPALATGMEMGGGGIPVGLNVQLDVVKYAEFARKDFRWLENTVRHWLDEDVCPYAPQAGGGHNFIPCRTLVDGQVGLYYVCEYCGKAYGDALEEAYQEYVATLPGTTYNSDGGYLWIPEPSDFYMNANGERGTSGLSHKNALSLNASVAVYYSEDGYFYGSIYFDTPEGFGTYPIVDNMSVVFHVGDYVEFSAGNRPRSGDYLHYPMQRKVDWRYFRAPVTGYYRLLPSTVAASAFLTGQGVLVAAGEFVRLGASYDLSSDSTRLPVVSIPWPKFWVTPLDLSGGGGNTYEIQTRVAGDNNTGLYGYVQDGQLYQSTVDTIYSEISNIYCNPVTGDTSTVTSWQYDYSDRSYTLTTNEGDTVSVTYGDEAVTINEGGTTYNVYYLMEETEDVQEALESYCDHDYASTVTTAPTCTASGVRTYTCANCGVSYTQTVPPTGHNYQSAVTLAPTCVNTGVTTFTCSDCGDSYTVSLPATGHVWEVVRTVPTAYDSDTGQLVQQGYTLYECSVCHEQYKIDADSGGSSLPAPSSGGTSTGTDFSTDVDSGVGRGFLATIAHGLTEDLPAAIQAASSWFTSLPSLYEGYTGFMSASVSWLPSDIQVLLRFSVGFVTFVGIIRRLWGRG